MLEVSGFLINSSFAMLLLPLWVAVMIILNAAVPFVSSRKLTLNLSLGVSLIGIIFSVCALYFCLFSQNAAAENNLLWLNTGDLRVSLGTLVDGLSAVIMLFFSVIFFLVQVYSYGYVKEEKNFHRFFIFLNLLNFSLTGLILSSNLVQTVIFWELSGVFVYFLINYWYTKKSASDAAKKTYLINKIGDAALLLGVIGLIYFSVIFSSAENMILLSYSNLQFTAETLYSMVSGKTFLIIAMLPVFGAMTKCAQFPFHSWVVDATEAPAPVNAILQGVIPVATGGLLLMRLYPLFVLSTEVLAWLKIVGCISALVFAYVAMSQNNIKKIFAYSTASQLGLFFVALGIGAYTGAGYFLISHGVLKVLLVLTAGVVVCSMDNENDIKYWGGLRQSMPGVALIFLLGSGALSGLLFSGFCANTLLLANFYLQDNFIWTVVILFVFFMSAYYLFRVYFLVFEGEKSKIELKKVSNYMKCPLCFLVVISIAMAFCYKKVFASLVYFVSLEQVSLSDGGKVVMLFILLCAVYITFRLYRSPYSKFMLIKERVLNKENLLYKLSYNCFYIEEVNKFLLDKFLMKFCRFVDFIDKYIVNGVVVILGLTTRVFSYLVSKLQNGNVQSYLAYSVFILAAIMVVIVGIYLLGSLVGV